MIFFIMGNGTLIIKKKEKVSMYGKMEGNMKGIGNLIRGMEKDDVFSLMETFTMENGKMIWLMVWEHMNIKMDVSMSDNGQVINSMDLAKKPGQIKNNSKEITRMGPNMDMEHLNMQMDKNI